MIFDITCEAIAVIFDGLLKAIGEAIMKALGG